ncbi:MAG: hypothetical protein IPP68_03835 [Elusimicrobia bacterium]|nr:hypothetical protein [Elusimicrobiota bacterium]
MGSGGNAIQQIYKAAFTFDAWPGNLSSNATSTVDKSVAGTPFSAGDPVFLGVNPTTFDPHIVISAYVLDSSTIRFVFLNTDSSSHTIGSLTYTVVVFN